jgi:hypothetical protein
MTSYNVYFTTRISDDKTINDTTSVGEFTCLFQVMPTQTPARTYMYVYVSAINPCQVPPEAIDSIGYMRAHSPSCVDPVVILRRDLTYPQLCRESICFLINFILFYIFPSTPCLEYFLTFCCFGLFV